MRLILTLHHHQPIGQLPWIVSDAVRDCYAPLLKVLSRHPSVKVALHYSGPLLEMLCAQYPIIIDQIKVLLERQQIELLGGAWWEAILPIWPQTDQIAQLQLTKERLKVLFAQDPQTAWLPERVWELELAGTLLKSGYNTTLLDSNGLQIAGAVSRDLRRINYTTQGLKVLSIDAQLRALIPWRPVDDVLEYLFKMHQQDVDSIIIFADDAEKFGSWPGTFQLIYEENYLDDLLTAFEQNVDWLQTVLPSVTSQNEVLPEQIWKGEFRDSDIPALFEEQNLQIPSTSYLEMLEWSDGNWRNFLDKYQESRDMYDTVLHAPRTVEALPHVLQAQCNDVYWHGVFGGLYLPHLRQAIYGAAASAFATSSESTIERTSSGDVLLRSAFLQLGVRRAGGQLFQWLNLQKQHNWLATLRSYEESYGKDSAAADWYARGAGIDHFLGVGATPAGIVTGKFAEEGDFVNKLWQIETRQNDRELVAIVMRDGGVWHKGDFAPLRISKTITLSVLADGCKIHYEFTNTGGQDLELWWASEWNVAPSGSAFPERSFMVGGDASSLEETGFWDAVLSWEIHDRWLKSIFKWSADHEFGLWQIPFQTISRREGDVEESIFQQATMVMHRKVCLQPGEKYFCEVKVYNVELPLKLGSVGEN